MSRGAVLITAERERQISEEGYTPQHDAAHHTNCSRCSEQHTAPLVKAAMAYLIRNGRSWWPWSPATFKPTPDNRVRELTKAGALVAAEIDRLLGEA